jgi:hypothetical protein
MSDHLDEDDIHERYDRCVGTALKQANNRQHLAELLGGRNNG